MRLKSIELFGFKSFPDRKKLDFGPGMTVVAGPNGSGKSNISDAIRWVLGEVSAKSVRGSKMEDVIFGGSDTRRALQFAEVSLTIDNTGEDNRLDSDFDEITVTRRCYRNGDSDYMINRRPVRLKDIAELFMNTGVGQTGYSIIGQGKIAEIISQKSDERRIIFEEAAGISKYRYKKNEAQRKIESMDENLIRLTDILGELTDRLAPLEKEAEKARRYLDIYEKKKKNEVGLWLYDLEEVKHRFADTDRAYTMARHEYEIADETLSQLDARQQKMFDTAQENKLKIEQATTRRTEYQDKRHKLQSSFAILNNDIEHLQEQIAQTDKDNRVQQAARQTAEQKQQELTANRDRIAAELDGLSGQIQQAETELAELRQQRIDLEAQQKTAAEQMEQLKKRQMDKKLSLSALENSLITNEQRRQTLTDEISALNDSIAMLDNRSARARKQLDDYRREIETLRTQQKDEAAAHSAEADQAGRITDDINKLTLDITSRRQRADVLRRMEDQLEGYAQGVRRVMSAVDEGILTGIYGPISRLITVKPRYAVAVETAIGAGVQNIVVENEEVVKTAIRHLQRTNGGRATFAPITSVKAQPFNYDTESLKKYTGYIGLASTLTDCDEKFRGIVDNMLGRTVVFDNLDNATIMAKATGYRIRIVTLDGQLINTGGTFTGGSQKKDSGMLSRSAEISRIENDITALNIHLKAKKQELDEINAHQVQAKQASEQLSSRINLLETMRQAENTQLQVLLTQLNTDQTRHTALLEEYEQLGNTAVHQHNEENTLREALTVEEGDQHILASGMDEMEQTHKALTSTIHKKQDALTALSIRQAEQRGEWESASRSLDFSRDTLQSILERIERNEHHIYSLNEKIIQTRNTIEENKCQLSAAEEDIRMVESELSSLYEESTKQDAALSDLLTQRKEQERQKEVIYREFTRLESLRSTILTEQDKLTEKLWDEYELTAGSAIEQGYSPIAAEERSAVAAQSTELAKQLKNLGSCNLGAIEEYKEVSERHAFISGQVNDLQGAKANLTAVIAKLENEMRLRFTEVMEQLNGHFQRIFRELFGGGHAELILQDPNDVLNCGIDINVAPPGKIIKNLSLLSGGEQSFAAIALFFAILEVNATPFCVLDEIEAALDDVNVARFADYALHYSDKTQFVIITHRRPTMERADTIYGVTMPERGISTVLTLNVNEVEEKLGVKL